MKKKNKQKPELRRKIWAVVTATEVVERNMSYDKAWEKVVELADISGATVVTNVVAKRQLVSQIKTSKEKISDTN